MATSYKILGQVTPNANTTTNVYVVPAATSAVISSVFVTNQGATDHYVSLASRPIDEALAAKHYIVKDVIVPAADALVLTLGISLGATNLLIANNHSANISYSAFGVEIT